MFSLIYVWINGWVNNREAGDLRSYYDVIVMCHVSLQFTNINVLPDREIVFQWSWIKAEKINERRCKIRLSDLSLTALYPALTNWDQNVGIFADDILKCIFLNEIIAFWFKFHSRLFPRFLVNHESFVPITLWKPTCDKPISVLTLRA